MREWSINGFAGSHTCENPINYNLSKINTIPNRLNKRISSIVNGYNRVKDNMLWCKLSKKKRVEWQK